VVLRLVKLVRIIHGTGMIGSMNGLAVIMNGLAVIVQLCKCPPFKGVTRLNSLSIVQRTEGSGIRLQTTRDSSFSLWCMALYAGPLYRVDSTVSYPTIDRPT
jgi:hypothetical protein